MIKQKVAIFFQRLPKSSPVKFQISLKLAFISGLLLKVNLSTKPFKNYPFLCHCLQHHAQQEATWFKAGTNHVLMLVALHVLQTLWTA